MSVGELVSIWEWVPTPDPAVYTFFSCRLGLRLGLGFRVLVPGMHCRSLSWMWGEVFQASHVSLFVMRFRRNNDLPLVCAELRLHCSSGERYGHIIDKLSWPTCWFDETNLLREGLFTQMSYHWLIATFMVAENTHHCLWCELIFIDHFIIKHELCCTTAACPRNEVLFPHPNRDLSTIYTPLEFHGLLIPRNYKIRIENSFHLPLQTARAIRARNMLYGESLQVNNARNWSRMCNLLGECPITIMKLSPKQTFIS